MDLFQAVGKGHGTADRDDGIAFRVRGGQASHQVGTPRAGRDQGHPRLARHAADAARDERGILFVPADHRLDPGVQQRVEHLVDLRAGNAEDELDALRLQTLHQHRRTRLRTGIGHGRAHVFSPSALARSTVGSRRRSAFKKSSVSGSARAMSVSRWIWRRRFAPRHWSRWPPFLRSSDTKCRW